DLVEFDGVRGNDLIGYGLVVGLSGTGDGLRNAPFTEEIMTNILERLGVNVDADDILSALSTALVGLTSAADVRTAVDTWFDTPGGGFDTIAYLGSDDPLDPFQISEVGEAKLDLLARDDEMRAVLKEFSLAALLDDGLLS
ncbi:Flagellar P-ring protein (Basal body P-ring protein), partial [Durusdinium trenchii]